MAVQENTGYSYENLYYTLHYITSWSCILSSKTSQLRISD